MLSAQVFDLFDQCKLHTLMTINFVLSLCRSITISINTIHFLFFFYKNLLYKNVEAEINQNCENVLRAFLRLRRSRLRMFLFWCLYVNEQFLFILNCYKILNFNTIKASTLIGFLGRLPFVRTDRSVRTVRKWNASVLRTERTGSGPAGPTLGVGPTSSLAPARLHTKCAGI